MSLTQEQLAQRLNYVTGSDASVILGVNPYESIIDLFRTKTGLREQPDISNNPRVKMGNMLEPIVAELFTEATGKQLSIEPSLLIHPENNWMAGNIDRRVKRENSILEIKTTSFGADWGEQGTNKIPKHYLCQIAHYMAVAQADRCHVAVLIGGWDFRTYTFERNLKLEEVLISKEKEFWFENVQKEIMPEPRNMDDVLTRYGSQTIQEPAVATLDIMTKIDALNRHKLTASLCDEEAQKIKNDIAIFMGQKDTLLDPNGDIILTWKSSKECNRFDTKSFELDHPELYKKYIKKTPGSRRFTLKGDIK